MPLIENVFVVSKNYIYQIEGIHPIESWGIGFPMHHKRSKDSHFRIPLLLARLPPKREQGSAYGGQNREEGGDRESPPVLVAHCCLTHLLRYLRLHKNVYSGERNYSSTPPNQARSNPSCPAPRRNRCGLSATLRIQPHV